MIIEQGEYKNSPMVVLKKDADDKWPFSFGAAKSALLLTAIAEHGLEQVIEIMVEVAGDKVDPDVLAKLEDL